MPLTIELEDVWPILIGNVKRAIGSDANAFRIEATIECTCRANKILVTLILQKARIEQNRADVWKWRADVRRDVQEIKAIEVRDVGQTIEWTTIRCGDEDVVMTGVSQVGSEATKIALGTQLAGAPDWR